MRLLLLSYALLLSSAQHPEEYKRCPVSKLLGGNFQGVKTGIKKKKSKTCTVWEIGQTDFDAAGTIIVHESYTCIKLVENVQFGKAWVSADQEPVSDYKSALGFFAAIVVYASHVEIDLNGFELSMHPNFFARQRFFSLIEVGSKPFISGQGPIDFGTFEDHEHHLEIHHGTLGLSSHHGIHGSNVNHVHLHHLIIKDFEVAGIQFNSAKDSKIHDMEIGPSYKDVSANPLQSNAIFMLKPLRYATKEDPSFETEFKKVGTLTLKQVLNELEHEIKLGSASPLFKNFNENGYPDGSAIYGIIIHRLGAAVGDVGSGMDQDNAESVHISNVHIHDLAVGGTQWGAVDGQVGVYGDLLNFDLAVNEKYRFNGGNAVIRAQLALGNYLNNGNQICCNSTTLHVDPEVIEWVASHRSIKKEPWFVPRCDVDVMGHKLKGAFGMRLEFVEKVKIQDITIQDLQSTLNSIRWCPAPSPSDFQSIGIGIMHSQTAYAQDIVVANVEDKGDVGMYAHDVDRIFMDHVSLCNNFCNLLASGDQVNVRHILSDSRSDGGCEEELDRAVYVERLEACLSFESKTSTSKHVNDSLYS